MTNLAQVRLNAAGPMTRREFFVACVAGAGLVALAKRMTPPVARPYKLDIRYGACVINTRYVARLAG